MLKPFLKEGLVTSSGSKWQQRRKLLQPCFHINLLRSFLVIFCKHGDNLVESLNKECMNGKTDIRNYLFDSLFLTVIETIIGKQYKNENEIKEKEYVWSVKETLKLVAERLRKPWLYYDISFYATSKMRLQQKLAIIQRNFYEQIIEDKKFALNNNAANLQNNEDYLETLAKNHRLTFLDFLFYLHNEGKMDNDGVAEELSTIVVAATETTSTTLSFFFMIIAYYTNVQTKLVEEIRDNIQTINWPPTEQDLQKFTYLERCLKETMRLFPTGVMMPRKLEADFVTESGQTLVEGTEVLLHVYNMHRNPNLYSNPDVFDSDRFLPEVANERKSYSFIPFGLGPRNCIGQRYAMFIMKIFAIKILRKYMLSKTYDIRPEDIPLVIHPLIKTKNPMYVKLSPRQEVI